MINREINGKSLIMQLFREHEIPVPLKTQGWIIKRCTASAIPRKADSGTTVIIKKP